MQSSAVGAGTELPVFVEGGEQGREIPVDRLNLDLRSASRVGTTRTRPPEGVKLADTTLMFDHQADRIGIRPLGRMAQTGWQEKAIAFADGPVERLDPVLGPYHEIHGRVQTV